MTPIWMAAILDLSNKAPTAGVQLGSRDKSKVLWPWPYVVQIWCFWDDLNNSGGRYELSPLTNLNTYAMGLTPLYIFLNLSELRLTLDVRFGRIKSVSARNLLFYYWITCIRQFNLASHVLMWMHLNSVTGWNSDFTIFVWKEHAICYILRKYSVWGI